MIKVVYVPSGNHAMALAGETLLERLHAAGAPIESVCRGTGACGTCIVEIHSGSEHLSAQGAEETDRVKRRGGNEKCRLSCQARFLGAPEGLVEATQPVLRATRAERERAARAMHRILWDTSGWHPILPEALQEMEPVLAGRYAPPDADHFFARRSRGAIEVARERIAACTLVGAKRVVFLSGWADLAAALSTGLQIVAGPPPALYRPAGLLSHAPRWTGWSFDAKGRVDLASVESSLRPGALAIAPAGLEAVGTRIPLAHVASVAQRRRAALVADLSWLWALEEVLWASWGADFALLEPALFGGPRGILVLFLGEGVAWTWPETFADPAAAVGAAAAIEIARQRRAEEGKRLSALRDQVENFFFAHFGGCEPCGDRENRLPQAACFRFTGWNADGLSKFLDAAGISLAGARAQSRVGQALSLLGHRGASTASAVSVWLGPANSSEEFEVAKGRMFETIRSFRAIVPTARMSGQMNLPITPPVRSR